MESTRKRGAISRLAEFAGPQKGMYTASVIAAILGVLSGMVPYFAVSRMIISLLDGVKDFSFYVEWIVVAALGLFGKELLHNISTAISHKATFSVLAEIQRRIASKLTRVPMGYVLDTPSGMLKNSMVEKVDGMEQTLAHVLPEMSSNLLVPLGIIVYLFVLDWRMALCSIITIPIGLVCYSGMMKGYAENFGKYTAAGKAMNAAAVEYVNGIEVIKAFGQSATSFKKYSDSVQANLHFALNWMKATQIYSSLGFGIFPAVLIGVLPAGCFFMAGGTLSAGVFITIMILSLGIVPPLIAAITYTDAIAKVGSEIDDICTILDQPEQIRPSTPAELRGGDIVLQNVSFSYGGSEVLHDVNVSIEAGTVNALVGPSGGGKSTIAKLIASFWDVGSGKVTVGDVDVKEIPQEQLMDTIAYVSQDSYLFDLTVMENLRMGNPKASDDQVMAAAKASGCHDFIMKLEKGYQTIVGGAGGHLSGGERQRIAIARAMLKDAPIIILDEATSYTDPENEAIVQTAVAKLVQGKTLVVIAHRLSTIADADQIIVVEQGEVAKTGRHDELLETCPLYKDMWQAHVSARDET